MRHSQSLHEVSAVQRASLVQNGTSLDVAKTLITTPLRLRCSSTAERATLVNTPSADNEVHVCTVRQTIVEPESHNAPSSWSDGAGLLRLPSRRSSLIHREQSAPRRLRRGSRDRAATRTMRCSFQWR